MTSDAELWRALAEADDAAFRELFVRHSDAVYNFCFRRTASWSVAEDAVQATFATVWRRAVAHRVDELRLDSARPVLLAMARAECSNLNRGRDRRLQLVDRVAAARQEPTDNTAVWVAAEATMRAIQQALAVLPRHQRDVVELVAFADLSMTEAAAALGISPGTVKSRLARARSRLAHTDLATMSGDPR